VTSALDGIRVVLLDIEGTTTPIAFVHERLFSHARSHLDGYLRANWLTADVQHIAAQLKAEYAQDRSAGDLPPWRDLTADQGRESVAAYVRWLMDRDRKSPGLKALQGLIWQDAYSAGELKGEVFDDVPRAMARWHAQGLRVAIYSSGSERAQRLLFASTSYGDLTPAISAFFDTGVGAKTDAGSYTRIAAALRCEPAEILFVSDVTAELSAAETAGCVAMLCIRSGNAPQPGAERFAQLGNFDALMINQ
jgi:enolase-phosphatase E1